MITPITKEVFAGLYLESNADHYTAHPQLDPSEGVNIAYEYYLYRLQFNDDISIAL